MKAGVSAESHPLLPWTKRSSRAGRGSSRWSSALLVPLSTPGRTLREGGRALKTGEPLVDVELVAVAVAAISATASAASAHASRQSVDRAHRAFVWPEIRVPKDYGQAEPLRVQLRNDGPGVAYDVRWSVGSLAPKPGEDWESGNVVHDDDWARKNASLVERAMPAGDTRPGDGGWLERRVALPDDDIWWVLVRWTDTSGARWELVEQGPSLVSSGAQQLQTYRWQFWRKKRDW